MSKTRNTDTSVDVTRRRRMLAVGAARMLARENFIEGAVVLLGIVATGQHEVTSDDVWKMLDDIAPPEPRMMGNVFERAEAEGLISRTHVTRSSKRRACHGRPVRVWISKIDGYVVRHRVEGGKVEWWESPPEYRRSS